MVINKIKQSRGISLLGFTCFLIVIVSLGLLGFKLGPAYFDNLTVKKSLEDIVQDSSDTRLTLPKAQEIFLRRLQVNNIRNVDHKALKVVNTNNTRYLNITYEVRVHIISNVDAVIIFENNVEVKQS